MAPAPHPPGLAHPVIDLTASPSPPPQNRSLPPQIQNPLPAELPPKTPVCIGQLTVTALVLYPIVYLQPQRTPNSIDGDWAPVRMSYEHTSSRSGTTETIHIRTPNVTNPAGEAVTGENFGVVEQKVASLLGPMLGKGLIRLDGKVRRGQPNLPILPLTLLVYTPKGNITVVANYLYQHGLFLDHPTLPSDMQRLKTQHYWNPHDPPPGGHSRALFGSNHHNNTVGRWNTVSGKSVEVQRSQVDELFKSFKDGDELPETDPPHEIATNLYPHQKKALTFMLEREAELPISGGVSLWQERLNPISNERSWYHVVTQREVFEEPRASKGAILADDMGLGKTISCVSLIACTLGSARAFAEAPLDQPIPPPLGPNDPQLTGAHFAGSVWGMPNGAPEPTSSKGKAKAVREQDKLESEYARACRLKTKSRATLIICPLSTVVNWEEQFKEHWRGEVEVVGGTGTTCTATQASTSASANGHNGMEVKLEGKPAASGRVREGTPLRVYVYHGNARKPDPTFLADFDAVITTYSTLAVEYSKQSKSMEAGDDEDDEDAGISDGCAETDERGNAIIKIPKSKKPAAKKRKKPMQSGATEMSSALQSIHWFRVVLDEAHSIKEVSTVACRASCDLVADRRLCLTGTPVQNKLDDVYALLKFLKLEPFDEKAVWTEFIGTPVKYGQTVGVARLQSIMKFITLRRTKESKAENGQKILSLPPRRDELRYLKFDDHEKAVYDQFFTESKAEFTELSKQNEVMKNYVGILQKILRLRQICDHFELVMNKGLGLIGDIQNPDAPTYEELAAQITKDGINISRATSIFALLREAGTAQCVECGYELGVPSEDAEADAYQEEPAKRGRKPKAAASRAATRQNSPTAPTQVILTRCQHLFCMMCFKHCLHPGWPAPLPPDTKQSCALCRAPLAPNDMVQFMPDMVTPEAGTKRKLTKKEKRQKCPTDLENYHPSTKIKTLLNDLIHFSRGNPYSANYDPTSIEVEMVDDKGNSMDDGVVKTVVFSQWTTMLDKIESALDIARIRYDRLDGTMKRDERTRAMEALKHDPGCEVLLVSLKAGGVGLNLTAAQRVYLMDPYWNPAVENQAVDRIHRLGQTRPVTTIKFIIENSIEARLLEVQRKKTELANMTLGQNFSKAELLQRRIEELNQLFGA
ncbi:hypothetical protein BDW22DRAFT_1384725 [Trametopsis cervina]|nr:hypothetical protein BDW22DRAFT_1384725 [Trametopsis cervina]